MTFFWSCNGFQGLVYVVSLVLPMLIQNGLFVSAHPAPHSAFPSAYIRYTDIKGSYPKQRQLECKPSACQSNKQYLEHFVKRNRETGASIIERDILDHHQGTFLQIRDAKDFVHLELRKRPYTRDYSCSTVVHTAFVVSAQTLQGASLWAPLVHVFIFRSSPSRQASFLRCITLNVSRVPVQSRVADDACEACLARVALQLKRRCCHSFRPAHKVA